MTAALDAATLYGLTAAQGWSAPSTVDLYGTTPSPAHAVQVDEHASCEEAGQLYGGAFCLATHKPGICVGTKRGGNHPGQSQPQALQRPSVAVPTAPAAKTQQQALTEQAANAGYQQAYLAAQRLAEQLGGNQGHGRVQAAAHDYARAQHQHGRAVARADAARTKAQGQHDTAVARNTAIAKANAAAQAAAIARANVVAQKQKLHVAARRHPRARAQAPSGWASEVTLYGLVHHDPLGLYAQAAIAHWACNVAEFCRNPLHPGPCKGWKHTLHAVAPGAYHALEKSRVAKLNEKRKAKIQALKDAGQPVPKSLLKEITYALPTSPQPGYTPPTAKEAQAALPVTAKEIGAKIALKHADIAAAKEKKLDSQHAALVNIAKALGVPMGPGQLHVSKQKMKDAKASQAPGENLLDHPVMTKTIDMLAEKASQAAGGLSDTHKKMVAEDIAAHVDAGIPEVPLLVQSAINAGKQKAEVGKPKAGPIVPKSIQAKQALDALVNEKANDAQRLAGYDGLEKQHLAELDPGHQKSLEADLQGLLKKGGFVGNKAAMIHHKLFGETGPGPAKSAESGQPLGKLKKTGEKLGTHGAEVAADEAGKQFLVKPHSPYGTFTSQGEVGASQLAKAVGLDTPAVHLTPTGTMQEMIPGGKDAFPGKFFNPTKLSSQDVLDLQKHQVVDWLIGNHDAHPGNFLRDKDGKLVEIDKGQAFKHYHEDQLSSWYHPNSAYGEQEPVYNTLLNAAKDGQVQLHSPAAGQPLGDFLDKVQGLPDAKVKDMFRPYATAAAQAGHLPGAAGGGKAGPGANPAAVEKFLDKIVERKKSLKADFEKLYLAHQAPGKMAKEPDLAAPAKLAEDLKAAEGDHQSKAWDKIYGYLGKLDWEDTSPAEIRSAKAELQGIRDHPHSSPEQSHQASKILENIQAAEDYKKQASAPKGPATAPKGLADEAQKILDNPNQGLTAKAQALTKEHFDALPSASQKKLIDGLKNVEADAGPTMSAKATEVIKKLTGSPAVKPSGPLPAAPLGGQVDPNVKHAQSLATGATYGTAKTKLAAYEKLSKADYHSLPHAVQVNIQIDLNEAKAKFLDPKKKASVQAVLDKLGVPSATTPAGAEEPSQGPALAKKMAAAHLKASKLAGAPPPSKTAESLLEKHYQEQGAGTVNSSIKYTADTLATAWSQKHLDGLPLSDEQKQAIKKKAGYEFGDMIADGADHPLPGGVIDLAEKSDAEVLGSDPFGAVKAKALAVAASQSPPKVAKSPAKEAVEKPAGLGKGKVITKISADAKDHMLAAYKNQTGSYLSSPAQDNYDNLLAVAHAHHGKPGFGSLSLSQVIDSIDEAQSKKLGVANSGALKAKISDWLATPEGKKYALAAKPIPAKVEAISAGIVEPLKLPKGGKLPKLAGPGPYKAAQTYFPAQHHGYVLGLQAKYQKETGTGWSPDQLSAIKSYTDSSHDINGYLRKGTDASPGTVKRALILQSAMLPIQENMQLNRGVDWNFAPPGFGDAESIKKLVGKTIDDKGFVSTAIAGESQGFSSNPVRLEIEAPKGTMGVYVEHVTNVTGEYEMILAAGTKFKVLKVSNEYDKTIVRLRVVS